MLRAPCRDRRAEAGTDELRMRAAYDWAFKVPVLAYVA
jgi:hypothetical protein